MRKCSYETFVAEVLSMNEPPIRAKGTLRQMQQVLLEFGVLPWRIDDPLFPDRKTARQKFLDALPATERDKSPRRFTDLDYLAALRKVMGEHGVSPKIDRVSDLRSTAIAAWIHTYAGRTPARSASLLRSMSSACSYAKEEGYISGSPFVYRRVNQWVRDQVIAPERPRPNRHQSAESIVRLLELLDSEAGGGSWKAGRLQALIYLLAYTGVRREEALSLRPWDINLERRVLTIEPRVTFRPKTRKSAAKLPIADALADVLALWLPRCGGEWVFPGVRLKAPWRGGPPGYKPLDEVRAAGVRAGIPDLTIASFRKTIGTLAKTWGLGQLELKALLRHSNVETQRWYDEEQVESLRHGVSKIQYRAVAVAVGT